ncbi:hypothetical protein SAMN05444392_11449 [Seinonella peptonophila]|uniref:Uncharacterized protein n=1 Tax=Seinonella peptonophila TaxID=112248 RepID=A0A1M5AK48_9BACL|nr:hypothetical protein [Seinonella peptonophila]SHF30497.1 hypothetical protein SAMN05444392_11449 [Seinonella peptonophila]
MSEEKKQDKRSRLQRFLEWLERAANRMRKMWQHPFTKQMKNWISQHKKAVLTTTTIILTIFIGLYTISILKVDSDEAITQFTQALEQEDVSGLQKLIEPDQARFKFNQKQAKDLIKFSQQDEDFFYGSDGILALLRKEQGLDEKSVTADAVSKHPSSFFYLKKKEGFLWDTYCIGVKTGYIEVTTNLPGVQVWINHQPVKIVRNKGKSGPFLPGIYQIKGSKKFPYTTVTTEREVNLFQAENRIAKETLALSIGTIRVYSGMPDTEIVINGKKTGQTVGNTIVDFGPVTDDGSLRIDGERSFPWGVLKSTPIPIKPNVWKFDLTPNPFSSPELKKPMLDLINRYAKERVKAKLTSSTKPYTSIHSKLKEKYEGEFRDQKQFQSGDRYQGVAVKTIVNPLKATATIENDGQVKVKIPVQFHFRERVYGNFDHGDEPLEDVVEDAYVWVVYDEQSKEWLITDLNSILFSDDLFRDSHNLITNF